VLSKRCGENQNTCVMFSNFFSEYCATYEMVWKTVVKPDRPQMTI